MAVAWEKIDQWLEQKYAPQAVPFFERNDESLRTLSAMMDVNQEQDARAQRVLQELQSHTEVYRSDGKRLQAATSVFGLDKSSLSSEASSQLDRIVGLAMLLGIDSISLPRFQQALLHHSTSFASVIQQEQRLQKLQARLDQHLGQSTATLQTLQCTVQPTLARQHEEVDQVQIKIWKRHTDLLLEKVAEYQRQLQDIQTRWSRSNNVPENTKDDHLHLLDGIRLSSLQALQTTVHALEAQIDIQNQALSVYTELPPDYKLARLKLSEVKFELEQCLIEQESLMQDLADGL